MKTELKMPSVFTKDKTDSIQKILCFMHIKPQPLRPVPLPHRLDSHCANVKCKDCILDASNKRAFITWFAAERIKGNFSII